MRIALILAATLQGAGLSASATAQTALIAPPRVPPSLDKARMQVKPDAIAVATPGPDEGRVEVKILGGGKVRFLGITCAVTGSAAQRTCSGIAKRKTSVILVAEPLPGHRFAGWSGGCAETGAQTQCTLGVDDSLISTGAVFIENSGLMVTLTVRYGSPPMMGMRVTLMPQTTLTCATDGAGPGVKTHTCTAQVEQGSTIKIKAEDSFAGTSPIDPKRWHGACEGATSTVCTLKMDGARAVDIGFYTG